MSISMVMQEKSSFDKGGIFNSQYLADRLATLCGLKYPSIEANGDESEGCFRYLHGAMVCSPSGF